MPDVLGVFPDRTVGGEFAHARDIQDRHACPVRGVAVSVIDLVLAVHISPVIGHQQEFVMMQEVAGQRPEQFRVTVGK